jgi:hypothetical protein
VHEISAVPEFQHENAKADEIILAYTLGSNSNPETDLMESEEDYLRKTNIIFDDECENNSDEVLEIVKPEFPEDTEDYPQGTVIDEFKEKFGFGIDTLFILKSYEA